MKKLFALFVVAAFIFAACGQKKVEAPAAEVAETEIVAEVPAEEIAAPADEVAVEEVAPEGTVAE